MITEKEVTEYVQRSNYIRAEYIGEWNGYSAYDPIYTDDPTVQCCIGWPKFILVVETYC